MKRCICEKFGGKIIVEKSECPVNHRVNVESEEPMKRCTKTIQPNVIIGYDEKGKMMSYYWQREGIQTRTGTFFTISRWKWWNPIWRFNQWRLMKKPLKLGAGFYDLPKRKGKREKSL